MKIDWDPSRVSKERTDLDVSVTASQGLLIVSNQTSGAAAAQCESTLVGICVAGTGYAAPFNDDVVSVDRLSGEEAC